MNIIEVVRSARGVLGGLAQQIPVVGAAAQRDRIDLDGKVVFITGAARGIGAEIARQAYAKGAYVSLVGRTMAPLEELAAQLGSRAAAFNADVSDFEALEKAAAATIAQFGGIDVVVANAGIAPPPDTLLTIDPKEFERGIDIDLMGQWRTIRATLPAVVENHGHVVVVSSIYAFFNGALNSPYAASKAAIEQLTRALRVELAPHGATAGVAYPGFVKTDMADSTFAIDHVDEARKALPGFVTDPIPVEQIGSAIIGGIERRSAKVASPWWVLPMLQARGVVTTVMDEFMIHNAGLSKAILRAEATHRDPS
ncbi:short-chain dehydrogenase/reductase [Antrihabitans stalactiti]|uniref:SDR family NAD(P)-dependent oxidoreductase n=1 Tax=Antrihabitans stalactiti TaxID=2584121 RepID=A0A848KCH1_9NOCA|nr:short-chain dehydrogenase/reductase [Antrihabitans stalactiti]NMN93757.1 SDR family NAD(P)-dependent oxidoreductase [Antrihabitans stalactiti]